MQRPRPIRQAACALIRHPGNGDILAISRGEDTGDWGIPGGAVEPGEQPLRAARRELREETGVELDRFSQMFPIYTAHSRFTLTTVFAVAGDVLVPEKMVSKPFEGYVEWIPPADLCKPACTFGEFQYQLFKTFGIL